MKRFSDGGLDKKPPGHRRGRRSDQWSDTPSDILRAEEDFAREPQKCWDKKFSRPATLAVVRGVAVSRTCEISCIEKLKYYLKTYF